MYLLEQLKSDKNLWSNLEFVPVKCSWCGNTFEAKYGTIYNIVRRNADGIFCNPKCSGSFRSKVTQEKYQIDGGKECKRCHIFLSLDNFSSLPNPPYFRAECKKCHNNKPARQFILAKQKAESLGIFFDIEQDAFLNQDHNCHYCGEQIRNIRLDLKSKEFGFTKNNTVLTCNDCQKLKGNLDYKVFLNICLKIAKHIGDLNE